jgi:hypothetical protein
LIASNLSYKRCMYAFRVALAWSTAVIPLLGIAYCFYLEHSTGPGPATRRTRWGLLAGLAAIAFHLLQLVGWFLDVSSTPLAYFGFLMVSAPLAGISFSLIALSEILRSPDHQIRSVGTTSIVIAGGSMAFAVALFFLGGGLA